MLYLKLFITFFRIGAFTLGGGYAMVPLIQAEIVDKNKWMSNEEFLDALAVAQSSPGALAVNTAVFTGYKISGLLGALSTLLGVTLPSFMIILIIAKFLYKYRNNPAIDKVFLGIGPAVVALISSAVYKIGKKSKFDKKNYGIALLALLIIVIFDISPIYVILAGGVGAVLYFKSKESKNSPSN